MPVITEKAVRKALFRQRLLRLFIGLLVGFCIGFGVCMYVRYG